MNSRIKYLTVKVCWLLKTFLQIYLYLSFLLFEDIIKQHTWFFSVTSSLARDFKGTWRGSRISNHKTLFWEAEFVSHSEQMGIQVQEQARVSITGTINLDNKGAISSHSQWPSRGICHTGHRGWTCMHNLSRSIPSSLQNSNQGNVPKFNTVSVTNTPSLI